MIKNVFSHCEGIGPVSETRLRDAGYNNWEDCFKNPDNLPFGEKKNRDLLEGLNHSESAFAQGDISHFTHCFPGKEHWRLLYYYFSEISFFDIETTGLSRYDSALCAGL